MKNEKLIYIGISFLIIGLLAGGYFIFLYGQDEIFLITGEEFIPFEYIEDGVPKGADVEIVDKIFKKMGILYEIQILPWVDAEKLMKSGTADLIFSISYKENREEYLYYNDKHRKFKETGEISDDTIWMIEYIFYKQKGREFDFDSEATIYETIKKNDYSVGIINGQTYFDEFWDIPFNFYSFKTIEDMMNSLNDGVIDLAVTDKIAGSAKLVQIGLYDEIEIASDSLYLKPYHMLFTKKSNYPNKDGIRKQFYVELSKMMESGEFQEIYDRHVLRESETG
ncbi:transporter substrate-binding domain-containing protein [Candidatus Pacearchaeota archaeon]|nr:transporter substrate-binding domain-containing protein [Candidatus Pacearchaeota archaeon]